VTGPGGDGAHEADSRSYPRYTLDDFHADLLPDDAWHHRAGPFEALGQRFIFRCTEHLLADLLADLFHCLASDTELGAAIYSIRSPTPELVGAVHRDDELIGTGWRESSIMNHLIWAVNRQVVERSLDHLLLHAAAADRGGIAVVLPAPMESGKTTLVTGLIDRGFGYLTDEAAAIDDRLIVRGYAKPLSIDRGSWNVLAHHRPDLQNSLAPYFEQQWQIAPHRVAPVVERSPLAALIFPRYEQGVPLRAERLSPGQVVAALVPCAFSLPDTPLAAPHLRLLARIASTVPAISIVYDDLASACDQVHRVISRVRPDDASENGTV
jgi:hypothetical protein